MTILLGGDARSGSPDDRARSRVSQPGRRVYGSFPEHGMRYFHGYEQPLAEFPAFSHINEAIVTADHVLPEHRHPFFEIVYFLSGRCRWTAGGRAYDLKPGDLWITRPGEPHSGRPDPGDPNHDFAIGFDPTRLPIAGKAAEPPAAGANDVALAMAEARAFDDDFAVLDQRVIPGGQGIEAIYRRILGELDRAQADATAAERALTVFMIQALLVELLVWVARCFAAQRARLSPAPHAPGRPEFQRLLAWLPTRLAEPPALAEMASRVGLSPAHFATVFKQETGQTPLEYLTAQRIEEAARRLATGRNVQVTDIALDLGFSSSQYFAIVFKKLKGRTPSEWQRLHAPG